MSLPPRELRSMSVTMRIVIAFLLVLIGGGAAFLATWDMPPPSAPVEKVIPNDRVLR
ncbi:MAG TPA: hypothetical protein VGC25_04935 [Alphaproteobacteria bacterium]